MENINDSRDLLDVLGDLSEDHPHSIVAFTLVYETEDTVAFDALSTSLSCS